MNQSGYFRMYGLNPQDLTAPDKLAEIQGTMARRWRRLALCAFAVVAILLVFACASGRYAIVADGPYAYVVDRLTGSVDVYMGGTLRK